MGKNEQKVVYCGCFPMYARIPPSTYTTCPLTKLDASEARNTAVPCRSSAVPHLAAGVFAMMNWSNGCLEPSGWISRSGAVCGVAIYPGPIPLH